MAKGSKIAPYGSWQSPITSDLIVSGSVGLSQPVFDGDDIYWIEMRPTEGGRNVIVKRASSGICTDVNPQPFNARTRAHEYGGGDYTVNNGTVYFSNFGDQRLYRKSEGTDPQPITPPSDMRYADLSIDKKRNRLICVREDHNVEGREAVNTIVSLAAGQNETCGEVLAGGHDFYSSPRVSPDGAHLAWLAWNHPNMPWDGSELWRGEIAADGSLNSPERIAGGVSESIFQPEWSPGGTLYFVSDRTGWWNLHRISSGKIEAVYETKAELGMPQWLFGMSSYAFVSETLIVCSHIKKGISTLATLDTVTKELQELDSPFTDIQYLRAASGQVVFRAGSTSDVSGIARLNLATNTFDVLRRSNKLEIDRAYFSTPESVDFPTADGMTAHGFFYRPQNADFHATEDERPPLIVKSHGGPTSAATTALTLSVQYWTSRGFAVLDVNYGGSTGYGREYREKLKGNWGIVDVDDCVNGARYLVERDEVDGNRLIITGGSAGGYTTLCALTFRDTFKAGASHFGVSDAEALARDTHKYESRYLDGLLGSYPEHRDVYYARSPINFAERLSCPVIFFQGLEDKVVPADQAEKMVNALRSKGIPVAYLAFEGEQHGFRQAKNIKRALDSELYFYSRIFGFGLGEPVESLPIENLK